MTGLHGTTTPCRRRRHLTLSLSLVEQYLSSSESQDERSGTATSARSSYLCYQGQGGGGDLD